MLDGEIAVSRLGTCPTRLSRACHVLHGGVLLFGGLMGHSGNTCELRYFSFRQGTWRVIPTAVPGTKPLYACACRNESPHQPSRRPRSLAASVLIDGRMTVHGGMMDIQHVYEDLHAFDLATCSWHHVPVGALIASAAAAHHVVQGSSAVRAFGHSMTMVGSNLLVRDDISGKQLLVADSADLSSVQHVCALPDIIPGVPKRAFDFSIGTKLLCTIGRHFGCVGGYVPRPFTQPAQQHGPSLRH